MKDKKSFFFCSENETAASFAFNASPVGEIEMGLLSLVSQAVLTCRRSSTAGSVVSGKSTNETLPFALSFDLKLLFGSILALPLQYCCFHL